MARLSVRALIAAFVIVSALPLIGQRSLVEMDIGESDYVPIPRILQPYLETYDLTGKKDLVFKWSPHEGDQTRRDHYDFRLYKGRQALGPALIYKTRVPPRQWSLPLSADMFEDGGVYTCTLRQVYVGSLKSRRDFQSFVVIKKDNGPGQKDTDNIVR